MERIIWPFSLYKCPDHLFTCNSSECISHQGICDGTTDCLDGSDEMGCVLFFPWPWILWLSFKYFQATAAQDSFNAKTNQVVCHWGRCAIIARTAVICLTRLTAVNLENVSAFSFSINNFLRVAGMFWTWFHLRKQSMHPAGEALRPHWRLYRWIRWGTML